MKVDECRAPLERRIGKIQEYEKYRNRIGLHVKNRGLKTIGNFEWLLFGRPQEIRSNGKHRKHKSPITYYFSQQHICVLRSLERIAKIVIKKPLTSGPLQNVFATP